MMILIRKTGRGIEYLVEDWSIHTTKFQVVAKVPCLMAGEDCLIATIETQPEFRGMINASKIS